MLALETPRLSAQPPKPDPHRPHDEDRPPDRAEQDVYGRDSAISIDQGDGEGEEDPADDVVAYTGGEDDLADLGLEEFGLGKDPTKYRKGGNRGYTVKSEKQRSFSWV
jgi:hypothetical protein